MAISQIAAGEQISVARPKWNALIDAANAQQYATVAAMAAATSGLASGDVVRVAQGYNSEAEVFRIVASGTFTVNGAEVVALAISGIQAVSTRTWFKSLVNMLADTRTHTTGTILEVIGVASFEAVASGGDFTNAASQNINLVAVHPQQDRDAETAAILAQMPDGTIVEMAGRWYAVDSTQTGADSCTNDLSIPCITPWGTAHPDHWGIDTTGATDVTTLLDRMIRWCVANSVPMDFDGCTSLVSGTVGPTTPVSGNLRFMPGKWTINVTGTADPADHVGHVELSGGNAINECDITIDCNDRIAGGFWIRQNVTGGVGQNRGFVKFSDGLQRNAAATTESAAWAYFGPFLYADVGRGLVDGMNRVINANSAATSGVMISGALDHKTVEGWTVKNIGAETMLPRITITDITQANPAVVTAAGHGLITGCKVQIRPDNFGGATMTQIEGTTAHTVTVIDADTFSLDGVDSTGFTAFTGTGYAVHAIYDFDGVKVFAAAGATGFAQREGFAAVRDCRFIDCIGRAVKLQSKGRVDDCFVQINGVPLMPDYNGFDGQIGPIKGRGNRFEYLTGAGVNPFLTGLSASAVTMQMLETDNVMDPCITDSVLVCESELPRFCTVITSATMLDASVLVQRLRGLRADGYSGDLIRDGVLYFNAGNVVTSGSEVRFTVSDCEGPFGARMIAYVGYTSGSVTGLFMEVENCRNTGTEDRPIHYSSGNQITDMTRFRLWGNDGFNHYYPSAVFDFKDLPGFTSFTIYQGSGTHTNAPSAWGGGFSGAVYGTIKTGAGFYGGPYCAVDFDVEVGGVVIASFKTKQATAANKWQEFRAVEQQPALSASVPSDVTVTATTGTLPTPDGSVTVADAAAPTSAELLELFMELRANQNAMADVMAEIVTDLTAANIHAS